jgi:hypothetical protein
MILLWDECVGLPRFWKTAIPCEKAAEGRVRKCQNGSEQLNGRFCFTSGFESLNSNISELFV